MRRTCCALLFACLITAFLLSSLATAQTAPAPLTLTWQTVVNNSMIVPGDTRNFNSYNQPSVNVNQLVVFRARSKGGSTGEPAHGVWVRNMKTLGPIQTILDRNTSVPQPNNIFQPPESDMLTTFIEPPAFPRIGLFSDTVATRANHQNVWEYVESDDTRTPGGTTGIYTNPFVNASGARPLITGASNLGAMPSLQFFQEPSAKVKFDVFPGAPAVTGGNTIVFKGHFTVTDENGTSISKTGVYYRTLTSAPIYANNGTSMVSLEPAGGMSNVVRLASSDTEIPDMGGTRFGSTAPPSAAAGKAVFAGFDNEDNPTMGGIYLSELTPTSIPVPQIKIGDPVPGEAKGVVFNKLGEGISFDGRFIAFWGAWGSEMKTLVLQCPAEGNADRRAYCIEQYGDGVTPGLQGSGFHAQVPVHQGIFVYDITKYNSLRAVAKTPTDFDDFVYWNFSGLVPPSPTLDASEEGGEPGGGPDLTGEPARWRSATFVAVSGLRDENLTNATYHVAFKARKGAVAPGGTYANPIDGIYLRKGPGASEMRIALQSGMDGTLIDPAATYTDEETGETIVLPVTEMGIERDGFRGDNLVINVSMGTEEAGFAGIYLTHIPDFTQ